MSVIDPHELQLIRESVAGMAACLERICVTLGQIAEGLGRVEEGPPQDMTCPYGSCLAPQRCQLWRACAARMEQP